MLKSLCLFLIVGASAIGDKYKALPATMSDVDIVYNCFYDHSWLMIGDHYCYSITATGNHWLLHHSTARQRRLRGNLQALLIKDRKDRALLRHCFNHHQFDVQYEPCAEMKKSILYPKTLRDRRMHGLWANEILAMRFKIKKTIYFEGEDEAAVLECLYTTYWLTDDFHQCHNIIYTGGARDNFSARMRKLHDMYVKQRKEANRVDCLMYHREDRLNSCYEITW